MYVQTSIPPIPPATKPVGITSNATLIGVLDATTRANLPQFLHRLSAGIPTMPSDEVEVVDLNTLCLQHPTQTCLYQAGGTSMIEAGIEDGAYLLVDRQLEAKSGNLVAACYFGETLIKQLLINNDGITLAAHSPNHDNLVIDNPEYLTIIGVVTWVFADKRGWRG